MKRGKPFLDREGQPPKHSSLLKFAVDMVRLCDQPSVSLAIEHEPIVRITHCLETADRVRALGSC